MLVFCQFIRMLDEIVMFLVGLCFLPGFNGTVSILILLGYASMKLEFQLFMANLFITCFQQKIRVRKILNNILFDNPILRRKH